MYYLAFYRITLLTPDLNFKPTVHSIFLSIWTGSERDLWLKSGQLRPTKFKPGFFFLILIIDLEVDLSPLLDKSKQAWSSRPRHTLHHHEGELCLRIGETQRRQSWEIERTGLWIKLILRPPELQLHEVTCPFCRLLFTSVVILSLLPATWSFPSDSECVIFFLYPECLL